MSVFQITMMCISFTEVEGGSIIPQNPYHSIAAIEGKDAYLPGP